MYYLFGIHYNHKSKIKVSKNNQKWWQPKWTGCSSDAGNRNSLFQPFWRLSHVPRPWCGLLFPPPPKNLRSRNSARQSEAERQRKQPRVQETQHFKIIWSSKPNIIAPTQMSLWRPDCDWLHIDQCNIFISSKRRLFA